MLSSRRVLRMSQGVERSWARWLVRFCWNLESCRPGTEEEDVLLSDGGSIWGMDGVAVIKPQLREEPAVTDGPVKIEFAKVAV